MKGNNMDEILKMITNYGFPIVMCAYLLIRMEAKLQILVDAMNNLKEVIRECKFVNGKV
jgi:hypothetical protein